MVLIAGLGNPTEKYRNTRHNAGFMVLDRLIEELKPTEISKAAFHGILYKERSLLLLKPTTYMNRSGESLSAVSHYYKPQHIIVIHDDLDIELGRIKLKHDGGHSGHNGLRSIDAHIGSDYDRIRIGIGKPTHKSEVVDYVLSDFSPQERPCLQKVVEKAAQLALELARTDLQTLLRHFSQKRNLCD